MAEYKVDLGNGKTLEFVEGDITGQTTDAIVNAANSTLMGGGGVDGAIHSRGGSDILDECKQVRKTRYPEGLPTGQAVATTAGLLPAKYVIHTVGPIWRGGGGGGKEAEKLASCYRESLRVAEELKLTSVAFPAVSTGIYGYPIEQATEVALATVVETLRAAKHVKLVRFVLFGKHDYRVYTDHARSITQG